MIEEQGVASLRGAYTRAEAKLQKASASAVQEATAHQNAELKFKQLQTQEAQLRAAHAITEREL